MHQKEELSRVRQAPIFAGLSDRDLETVVREGRRIDLAAHQLVFRQGETARDQFLLLRGRVKISQMTPEGQDVILRFISPGEIFAIVAALGQPEYPATAETVEDSAIISWSGPAMAKLIERIPAIAINTVPILSDRIRELQDRLRELMTERVERRIARTLLRLTKQAGRETADGILIDMTMTRQTVAELAGTTLFTASRTMSAWEKNGIIKCGREQIVVCDSENLELLAEDL